MQIYQRKSSIVWLGLALALTFSCKKTDKTPIQKKGIQLAVDSKFGTILTDSAGRSLYIFASDAAGNVNCTGNCETTWPLYYSESQSTDKNLKTSEVGIIIRTDGKKQNTYKGYPLYYYKNDIENREIKGDGIGGLWFVAKPDYNLMLANYQLTGLDGKNYLKNYVEGIGKTIYLTDDKGRTLYAFEPDKYNKNTFTTEPLMNSFWPVYEGPINNIPSAINKDLFGSIDVAIIGRKQMTFKGWPLYYYYNDLTRGDNKSITVGPTPGSFWQVLTLDKAVALP